MDKRVLTGTERDGVAPAPIRDMLSDLGIGVCRITVRADDPPESGFRADAGLAQLMGYAVGGAPGNFASFSKRFVHPDDVRIVEECVFQRVSDPQASRRLSFRLWNAVRGRWRWVDGVVRTERQNQEDGFVVAVLQESDVRHALEKRVAEQSSMLAGLVSRLAALDGTGEVNPAAAALPVKIPGSLSGLVAAADRLLDSVGTRMRWQMTALDCVPLPIQVIGSDLRWIWMNRKALLALGHGDIGEVAGESCCGSSSLCGSEDCVARALSEGVTAFTATSAHTGETYQGHAEYFFDGHGAKAGHVSVLREEADGGGRRQWTTPDDFSFWEMQDYTETREAEERIRIMLDALPITCTFFGDDGVVDCNLAAVGMFNLSGKQAYLDCFDELSPLRQPDGSLSSESRDMHIARALEHGSDRFSWLHQDLQGSPIPTEVSLVRVSRDGKELIVGYTADLRELNAKQELLNKERELLRRIVEGSPVSFLISVDGVARFMSGRTGRFLGIGVGDSTEFLFADSPFGGACGSRIEEGRFVGWSGTVTRHYDGKRREILINASRADYEGESGVMLWLMDVTELKDRERDMRRARDEAEESLKAKSEFLANMSHEVRTPMNAVIGLSGLLMQTDLSEVQREYVSRVDMAARSLLHIINDILDFSKIEAGKLDIENIQFHLEDILKNTVDLLADRAHAKGLEFILDLPPRTPTRLIGDPLRLSQILTNLINNAIKFTEKGEVIVSVRMLEKLAGTVTLRFSVKDSGIGMTEAQVDNLFMPFNQADSSITRKFGGTGLGLAICKRLVEMMGGAITCESSFGEGSVFSFDIRFSQFTKRRETSRVEMGRDYFKDMRALAVDDNPASLAILRDVLESMGFTVATAESGEEALAIVAGQRKEECFDLLLLDWKMPGLNGIETLQRIRETLPATKFPAAILSTAFNQEEVMEQARQAGITHVLSKPLSASSLLRSIQELFGRRMRPKDAPDRSGPGLGAKEFVSHLQGARILLVEDNSVNQLVATRILQGAGFEVKVAENGIEAVEAAGREYFDLVLMDIQMPEMDGLTATAKIREREDLRDLPIVAMTAHAMADDREASLKAGMDAHITKPISVKELFTTIGQLVRAPGGRRKK